MSLAGRGRGDDRSVVLGRRDVLKVGPVALAATVWPGMTAVQTARAATGPASAKSVIVLWMAGGVTHIDSFDPKPEAPENVRGTLSTIETTIPGVRFTEVMPNLARAAHRMCLVRSLSHDNNDHFMSQAYALSGRKVPMSQITTEPNVGAVVSHVQGPRASFPGYITVPGTSRPGPPPTNLFTAGWLGEAFSPFSVGGEPAEPDFTKGSRDWAVPKDIEEDLRPEPLRLAEGLSRSRLERRTGLRDLMERALRTGDPAGFGAHESHHHGALGLLRSAEVRRAFDLREETAPTREAYGRTKIGGRCLLARRLVEAGARFVLVDYAYDPDYGNLWDNHCVPEQKQPHISEMAKRSYHLAGLDKAFAALLDDLAARGLLDSTLVVFLTEFGRTPQINALGGRDHWGAAGSIFFAGGGATAGNVIGATDRQGGFPTGRSYTHADVAATIYRALGVPAETVLHDRQNRPVPLLPAGSQVDGVLA